MPRPSVSERILRLCLASGTEWQKAGVTGETVTAMVVKGMVDRSADGHLALTKQARGALIALLREASRMTADGAGRLCILSGDAIFRAKQGFGLFAGRHAARDGVERRREYRRQAAVCYEIAATLTGEKASSMLRLGDAYAALAVAPDLSRFSVFAAQKLTDPLCKKCGKKMQLADFLPGTDIAPPIQAFRCAACGEIHGLATTASRATSSNEVDQDLVLAGASTQDLDQHYIAASFRRAGGDFIPGPVVECPDASMAIQRAELMLAENEIVGAVAFSRRVDPITGAFKAAVLLKACGEIPGGF